MKKKYLLTCVLCVVFGMFTRLDAQVNGYACDFEDEAKYGQWVLNAGPFGPDCTNKWYIGSAVCNGGESSLYISNDGGVTAGYLSEGQGMTVSAYTKLHLSPGKYELSFDWQALGTDVDAMYVCWIPMVDEKGDSIRPYSNNLSANLPKYVTQYGVILGGNSKFNNSRWNSVYSVPPLTSDGEPHYLVFVWNNGVSGSVSPAACVDNINMIPLGSCTRPSEIQFKPEDMSVTVTWEGLADSFDVRVKSRETGEWIIDTTGVQTKSIVIQGVPEGAVEIYVRSACDEFHSSWVTKVGFIYYPGLRCVDFLSLSGDNCYIGQIDNPYKMQAMADQGYEKAESRHTVHYNKDEVDPRTGGGLKTVSPFDIASVRLGNWLYGKQAEGIVYDIDVPADAELILLLHYAVVLQVPDHAIERQPRFTLEILDEKLKPLNDTKGCTYIDFAAGYGTGAAEGWEELGSGEEKLTWKNWTTVGINLADYKNQKLKVRVTTYDCADGQHYGYAYFAMSCTTGVLHSKSCGKSEVNVFEAPDGFRYRWYKKKQPDATLSTEQQYSFDPTDPDTLCCDLYQLSDNSDCYFTLYANAMPRYPVAAATYKQTVQNCRTVVQFTDSSHVVYWDAGKNEYLQSEDLCDSVFWDFGDGTTSTEFSPTHTFPDQGGTYKVRMKAYLAECDTVTEYAIEVPDNPVPRDSVSPVICHGEVYRYRDWELTETGRYHDTVPSVATGCDSVFTINLTVIVPVDSVVADTVCTDDLPYVFHGMEYNETGEYPIDIKSSHGCDSINIVLDLLVNESLNVNFPENVVVCADDSAAVAAYELLSGLVSQYSVSFDDAVMQSFNVDRRMPEDDCLFIPINETVKPGRYGMNITLCNADCGDVEKHATLDVRYPDSILVQRWNDVVAVRNAEYNGGYEFVAFQWFVNDEVVPGATSANLYVEAGLDVDAEYSVLLTRLEDGVSAFTCPLVPEYYPDVVDSPIVTFDDVVMRIQSAKAGRCRVFNAMGLLLASFDLNSGETEISLPGVSGVCVMEIVTEDGVRSAHKVILKDKR